MSDATEHLDEPLRTLLEVMAQDSIHRAAEGFSGMMGKRVTISQSKARLVPFAELPNALCGPENEAVGIYLQMQGQMSGQVMLEAEFVTEGRSVAANCWIIPDPAALEKLSRQDLGHGR